LLSLRALIASWAHFVDFMVAAVYSLLTVAVQFVLFIWFV
jgi:hypothetical protein